MAENQDYESEYLENLISGFEFLHEINNTPKVSFGASTWISVRISSLKIWTLLDRFTYIVYSQTEKFVRHKSGDLGGSIIRPCGPVQC